MHKATAEQAARHPAAKALSQTKADAVLGERWRGSDLFSPVRSAAQFHRILLLDRNRFLMRSRRGRRHYQERGWSAWSKRWASSTAASASPSFIPL